MNIQDLYRYMKLIFVKNVKNNSICNDIFKYILNANFKNNTKSFIKDFVSICSEFTPFLGLFDVLTSKGIG